MTGDSTAETAQDLLTDGEFIRALQEFLTAGGDPTLQIVMPSAIYGSILLGLFIYSQSVTIPLTIAIILGGVLFTVFPSNLLTLLVLVTLFGLAAAGMLMTWRLRQ